MRILKAILLGVTLCLAPVGVHAQDHAPATPVAASQDHAPDAATDDSAADHAQAGDHATQGEEHAAAEAVEHAESGWSDTIAKAFNFALLVGILVYFLRRPTANYLVDRSQHIRRALVEAAATRQQASSDLESIQARLAALPAELEALTARGADEVKAEEARIRALAASERERLLALTRREIDQQYRLRRRELVQETAEQAAAIARARIERDLTPTDQTRLIDRYLNQVVRA